MNIQTDEGRPPIAGANTTTGAIAFTAARSRDGLADEAIRSRRLSVYHRQVLPNGSGFHVHWYRYPLKGIHVMFKSTSTQLILLGVLAIIVGIIAIAWPGVTVLALVILFAVYAFIDAGLQAARAFSSGSAGPVFGHLLLGLVDLAAGVIALVWPGPTALVLVLIVGIWAFIGGIAEIVAGFAAGETAGTRAMFILAGLVSIAFGVVLFARPGIGAVTLALLFGLFSLIYGISQIVMGGELRRTGNTLHSVLPDAA
jgi:uncharacterized membrane protein HdeD (DUF308 family)